METLISWLISHEIAIREWSLAIGTLILALVAYLQVRASYKQISESRLQRKIEKHNEDLRELFQKWHDSVSRNIIPDESKFYNINYLLSPMSFEQEALFSDLEKHLPAKYEDLMKKWGHCRELIKKYCQLREEIFNKIDALILSDMQKDELISKFPPESIFFKAIALLTGKEYCNYKTEENANAFLETTRYGLSYKDSDGFGFQLTPQNIGFSKEEINKIKIHHENMSEIFKTDYETNINNLINVRNELEEMFKELKDNLIKLTKYPDYNNMTCEYIMPETRNWIQKLLHKIKSR